MKKIILIFIFIFLTGLFAGFFFSMNLSEENSSALSSSLMAGLTSPGSGFFRTFMSSFGANFTAALFILPALFFRFLCVLPPAVLWFRSFATGFCCGMIFLNESSDAFIIALTKMLPHNLLLLPGIFLFSVTVFCISADKQMQKSRLSNKKKSLLHILIISVCLIFAGSLIQAISHSIAL